MIYSHCLELISLGLDGGQLQNDNIIELKAINHISAETK